MNWGVSALFIAIVGAVFLLALACEWLERKGVRTAYLWAGIVLLFALVAGALPP